MNFQSPLSNFSNPCFYQFIKSFKLHLKFLTALDNYTRTICEIDVQSSVQLWMHWTCILCFGTLALALIFFYFNSFLSIVCLFTLKSFLWAVTQFSYQFTISMPYEKKMPIIKVREQNDALSFNVIY